MKLGAKSDVLLFAYDSAEARLVSQVLVGVPAYDFVLHVTHKISDALCYTRAGAICAVILDIDVPMGVGLEVFDQLFDSARHLPFLIVCVPATEQIAREAVKRGARDYLLKSHFQQSQLRRVVSSLVKQHAAEEAAFFSQQCAEAMLDCTTESVLISDNSGHILRLNPAAEVTTGWTHAEAFGHTSSRFSPSLMFWTRCPRIQTSPPSKSLLRTLVP